MRWFRTHYPDIAESTVSTYIAGLTRGKRPNANLAHFPPLMERVGHGLYRQVDPNATTQPHESQKASARPDRIQRTVADARRIVLIGCVKSKRTSAAPARELYTSTLFARRRAYAEGSGNRWYIVSARLGLVAPDEVIAPYDCYLADRSAGYRAAWGALVASQLAEVEPLRGSTVEIHAGDAYVNALRGPLEALGSTVTDPVDANSMGATLAWYDRPSDRAHAPPGPADISVEALIEQLLTPSNSLAVPELLAQSRTTLATPGMYSWWVDALGAEELTTGLGHAIPPGLIYAGQAGATRWPSGRRSTNTLWGRLADMHLGARAEFSTFRLTLAAILQPHAGGAVDEVTLTDWMTAHLRVVAVPMPSGDPIDEIETEVLARLDPPLNLAKRPSTPLRRALSERRKQIAVR